MTLQEAIIKELDDLGKVIYKKFGTSSYTERCMIHDIKESIKKYAQSCAQEAREKAIEEAHELYLKTNHRSMYQQKAFKSALLKLKEKK